MKSTLFVISTFLSLAIGISGCGREASSPLPNIVIIYADDMGYGDLNCQNPGSKIPTPHLDQLAREGMLFTDAHSSSGICSPSRFALLTGQYHWRRAHGIVGVFGAPMFREGDITLPKVLKEAGYVTACIGKWHLGWDWNFNNEPSGERTYFRRTRKVYLPEDIDWSEPAGGGPLARGFDYYFGDGTINFPPYAWVENDRVLEVPDEMMEFDQIGYEVKEGRWEFRPGPKVKDWNPYQVLPTLTRKAVTYIQEQKKDQPFFLYFPLPSPHAPIIPNEEFSGKSQAGAYGDFMVQTDRVAGQVLEALKEKEFEKNTIVIFTSDNGPERYAFARAERYDHFSMGDFRGLKRDVWEGGHHIPMIVKWPGKVKAGTVSDVLISQIDLMATLAAAVNIELRPEAAPDSKNFLPVWTGKNDQSQLRESLVHNTRAGLWGLRKGKWLYINQPSGGISEMPESFKKLRGYTDFTTEGLLFNLETDAGQRTNLYEVHPDIVSAMEKRLGGILEQNYTLDR